MTSVPLAFIDTHAHLDDEQFAGDVEKVIARAKAAGVGSIVNIGYRPSVWRTTLELASQFPEVEYTLGLHPNHADEWSDDVERELIRLLQSHRPVAIGEIGLDYFRDHVSAIQQRAVFQRQLEIAREHQLPVVIHQRAAEAELIRILRDLPDQLVCVLHSFDGTKELATLANDKGYYLGVGGLMTRNHAASVRTVLKDFPLDRLLLETDAPYLIPAGIKARRNESSNLPLIALGLAELKGMTVEEIASATTTNALRLLPLLLSATATTVEGSIES